jgi:hypothetical protein
MGYEKSALLETKKAIQPLFLELKIEKNEFNFNTSLMIQRSCFDFNTSLKKGSLLT